jgi:Protein of unknown function (DUF3999)
MTRQLILSFLTLAVLSVTSFAVDLPGRWRTWRYSRPIEFHPIGLHPAVNSSPLAVHLSWDIVARSNSHGSDLRIIDDGGQEIPYSLVVLRPESRIEKLPSQILERSFVAGEYTQIVIRITKALDDWHGATLHQLETEPWFNTYRITTPKTDFMYWVETAVSDDAHEWRIIDPRSPISRLRKNGIEGNQTIQFAGYSNQRYLRLRILDQKEQFPVDGVDILSRSSWEPPRALIPAAFSTEKSSDEHTSRWRADLGTPNLPVSELDISTDQSEFHRTIHISTSDNGDEWNFTAAGEAYRLKQRGKLKEFLQVNFPEAFARFWRVDVLNENDQPLTNVHLELHGVERQIYFRAEPPRSYRILYGNDKAPSPAYDFGKIFDQTDPKILPQAQIGPEDVTNNYYDPRPFTERHPNVLWVALGAGVILLGYTALRTLRPTAPQN